MKILRSVNTACGTVSTYTVEHVLKAYLIGHKSLVAEDRWSLVTGSFTLKCRTFCPKLVVLQDRWSLTVVVSRPVSLYHITVQVTKKHLQLLHRVNFGRVRQELEI